MVRSDPVSVELYHVNVNHSEHLACARLNVTVINCGNAWIKRLNSTIGRVPLFFNRWQLARIE